MDREIDPFTDSFESDPQPKPKSIARDPYDTADQIRALLFVSRIHRRVSEMRRDPEGYWSAEGFALFI